MVSFGLIHKSSCRLWYIFSLMPFPLAHPAAVLPFRRYCSRWLNFPALVIGSLVPDLGYLFPPIQRSLA